jgi:2-isopropylmalate synthase
VALLRAEGRRVFLDAEHFFDGFQFDPDTALRVLDAAMTAGADVAVLCDTNGGMLPLRLAEIVGEVADRTGFRLGIHCQDDTGCAVANSVAAVQAGASHVQCTANGYGERAGNADLFAVVGNLVTKLDMPVLPDGAFAELTRTSHALAEIANIAPDTHQAYVGASAFAHKAGLHASAIKVDPELYNHMDPTVVGNGQRVLVTEMAGRASVELKGIEFGLDLAGHPAAVSSVVATVKEREANGWSFEAAEASLELLMRSAMDPESAPVPPFTLESYRVIVERRADGEVIAEATVKMVVDGRRVIATEEGNGPVNALDAALRAALSPSCPWLDGVELSDYKVRILNPRRGSGHGTDAVTRVLVESTEHSGDRAGSWTTVGVHGNVVEASWLALVDALTFASMRQRAPLTAVR